MKVPCGVPFKVCGAHIFFLFQDYINAGEFRDKASEISAVLEAGMKFFPKQEQILVERGDVELINLPYFDEEQTLRFAIKEDESQRH